MNNQKQHENLTESQRAILQQFIIPSFRWVETQLLRFLLLFSLSLIAGQVFILSSPENQALVNKAIRYEGVFDTEEIEAMEIWQPVKTSTKPRE